MISEDSVLHLATLLRTMSEDVDRLASLLPGQESARAAQNVRSSLDAIRQLLIPIAAGEGVDTAPLLAVCFDARPLPAADFDDA